MTEKEKALGALDTMLYKSGDALDEANEFLQEFITQSDPQKIRERCCACCKEGIAKDPNAWICESCLDHYELDPTRDERVRNEVLDQVERVIGELVDDSDNWTTQGALEEVERRIHSLRDQEAEKDNRNLDDLRAEMKAIEDAPEKVKGGEGTREDGIRECVGVVNSIQKPHHTVDEVYTLRQVSRRLTALLDKSQPDSDKSASDQTDGNPDRPELTWGAWPERTTAIVSHSGTGSQTYVAFKMDRQDAVVAGWDGQYRIYHFGGDPWTILSIDQAEGGE